MTPSSCIATDRLGIREGCDSGDSGRAGGGRPRKAASARPRRLAVLPGEDARALRARLREWIGSLGPRNPVELYLVERAVLLSWQLDRAHRAQVETMALSGPRGAAGTTPDAAASSSVAGLLGTGQLDCGSALLGTLHAFSELRGTVAALTLADAPAPSARAAACLPSPGDQDVEAPGAGRPAVGEDAPGPHRSPRRRRPAGTRLRCPGWSSTSGTSLDRAAAGDPRIRPASRAHPAPDSAPSDLDSRRRVGGYTIPLDQSFPISCADRIPVRLRRRAAAATS